MVLSGCSIHPRQMVTVSRAIASIQADLAKTGASGTSRIQELSPIQMAHFDANIRPFQCTQKTPYPIVPMISGRVQLTGSYTRSRSFSVSTMGTAPVLEIGSDASQRRNQQITLPAHFIPLSALADAEAERETDYAEALLAQPNTARKTEGARIANDRDHFAARLSNLMNQYAGSNCPDSRKPTPLVEIPDHA
ncbi:hypothetical protein [Gluconobacter morbifer]|uniref:Uncharacterized protein n=1 Tax=Gluconobacter morbifer G707 TaxID=1088869 RepID=G6XH13_9PROT|nr:hypothetical protein [Gluconobacter morbifer]EHH69471.1 hypothetical protein GMO_07780 [Gluconobacter morbifer G707]